MPTQGVAIYTTKATKGSAYSCPSGRAEPFWHGATLKRLGAITQLSQFWDFLGEVRRIALPRTPMNGLRRALPGHKVGVGKPIDAYREHLEARALSARTVEAAREALPPVRTAPSVHPAAPFGAVPPVPVG